MDWPAFATIDWHFAIFAGLLLWGVGENNEIRILIQFPMKTN